jgi:SpoU rRNA methylase family enzyme
VKANVAVFNGLDDGIDVNNPDTTIADRTSSPGASDFDRPSSPDEPGWAARHPTT